VSRSPLYRLLAVFAAVVVVTRAPAGSDKPVKVDEAARVRFLIVADTSAKEGDACGLDADNFKAVLEAGLKKQKLDGRFTVDVITGRDVTPERVLNHYRDLAVSAQDALVFYYSGHGAFERSRGHLLTFVNGDLPRSSVLEAMQKHRPRLAVVLSDCCAIYDDPPPGKPTAAPNTGGPKLPGLPRGSPPRPKDYTPPTATTKLAHPPRPENYRPAPPTLYGPDDNLIASGELTLFTGDGPVTLKSLLAQTDGELMRHLFFRHRGLVDINGCEKGKAAYATTRWGGGLFTINFLGMQKETAGKYDANRNGVVEWGEFFGALRSNCDRAAKSLTRGQIRQTPEAMKLGQLSIVAAAR
jgi:hypothetical protein